MMRLVSYAQNFEDIILWRALSHVQEGFYVDIGAQSPDIDSVSRLFSEHQWKGVHVEPTPTYADQLRIKRPRDVVLQCAISAKPGALKFFEVEETGLSTSDENIAEVHASNGFAVRQTSVAAITLDSLYEHIGTGPIHWLKIDVEGAELLVLEGWVSSPARPWVVVVESTRPLTTEQTHETWEPLLVAKGYRFEYFDGLNRFYLSDEHRDLAPAFLCGPNVFDGFSLSSSSTFCAEVNIAYHELELAAKAHELELRSELEGQQRLFADQIETLSAASANELEVLRARHSEEIAVRTAQFERERSQNEELVAQERFKNSELLAQERSKITGLVAKVDELKSRLVQLGEENKLIRHTLQKRIEQARHNAQQELEASYKRSDELAHEAHRWWVNAEALRSQLQEIQASHSWRLTAPLRAFRRRAVNVAARGSRASRRLIRPLLLGSMKQVLDAPLLRSTFKPIIARFPVVNSHLVALASTEGLLSEGAVSSGIMAGRERALSPVHLDVRARAVFADINQAMDGEAH
ncbi:MAG TPA: FkbM family methyltransferase [Stenotrophomonas sp.]|jgi:FkbM family methyltransferase